LAGGSRSTAWRLLRDNATPAAIVGLALYAIIRGQIENYDAGDVPFLMSVVAGLIGLTAVDSFIERKSRLTEMAAELRRLEAHGQAARQTDSEVQRELTDIRLAVSALQHGAAASTFLADDQEIPRERFQRARTIYWTGVTLRVRLRQRLRDLGVALEHGADLSLLIIDPQPDELREELTVREKVQRNFVDGVFSSTLLNLQLLAGKVPRQVSFRLGFHPVFPTVGLTIFDPDDADGVCYVEIYPTEKGSGATFVVHASADPIWFRYFVGEFVTQRERARVYEVRNPSDVEAAVQGTGKHAR
jgi:hypothetical protein